MPLAHERRLRRQLFESPLIFSFDELRLGGMCPTVNCIAVGRGDDDGALALRMWAGGRWGM